MYIKLNQSQGLDLLAELRNLLLFFSHLSFRVLKFANNILISGSSVLGFSTQNSKVSVLSNNTTQPRFRTVIC